MREFFGGVLGLAAMAGFVLSVIAIFRPLPKLHLPTRARAALGAVASFLLMAVAGAILPPQPETAQPAKGAEAKAGTVEPAVDLKVETKALWTQVLDQVRACDESSNVVSEAFDRSRDVYDLYNVVSTAQARCKDSWQGLNGIDPPPSAKGDVRKGFVDGVETCGTAYWMKYHAYEKMAKVLDGDMRPSAVAAAKAAMQEATGAQLTCVAGLMTASEKAGVPTDELAAEMKKDET